MLVLDQLPILNFKAVKLEAQNFRRLVDVLSLDCSCALRYFGGEGVLGLKGVLLDLVVGNKRHDLLFPRVVDIFETDNSDQDGGKRVNYLFLNSLSSLQVLKREDLADLSFKIASNHVVF